MKYSEYLPPTASLIDNDKSGKNVNIFSASGLLKKEPGTVLFGPYKFTFMVTEKVGERMRNKECTSCNTYLVKLDNWKNKILNFAEEEVQFT